MKSKLLPLLSQVRQCISAVSQTPGSPRSEESFEALALELFREQFQHNAAYRRICEARVSGLGDVHCLAQIPAVPVIAFKELDLTCLAVSERTHVFHSSGTTGHHPSRHFHCPESIELYRASALAWFGAQKEVSELVILTPTLAEASHSSLVSMFEWIRCEWRQPESVYVGRALAGDGGWELDVEAAIRQLRMASKGGSKVVVLGTAFLLVRLLDGMKDVGASLRLPEGSRVFDTGGYKGRSREVSKEELRRLIAGRLGVPRSNILGEYGMSELSSQAYDRSDQNPDSRIQNEGNVFRFPPWARSVVVSAETGSEVADGETGLLRVYDLANVFSVMAIQTDDLAVRRADGFELVGRAALAESRGCSLMSVE